ncbi:MAG: 6-chlorohydroxyquinol-1,2-dioxygenase [Pseudomonadales bacterium]|jgi:catechol 1,2-dioxygenase|nr:6-chlorohydroxyquinol-1,2-dioxygenase [Pseudomonadales bacterium]
MNIEKPEDVTAAVLAVMQRTHDPRLREIMLSLIKHLHGFITEVGLTEAEFRLATDLINELGQRSNDSHNETVLMAGSLGVSALVCLLNNGDKGARETSHNLLGPFWRLHSPRMENGASIVRSDTPGPKMFTEFTVVDPEGQPVADAEVDIWHASPVGYYENQDPEQAHMNLRGKFITDAQGRVSFWSVRPKGYPIPTDGVVGRLLDAQSRHPYRPAHVHALVFKPGFKTLISQIYLAGDPHMDTDVQFGVTRALTAHLGEHHEPPPGSPEATLPWYSLKHVLHIEPGEAKLPRPPIR